MSWTQRDKHRLVHVRVQVLNEDSRATFCEWYPGLE
jgi:hypothetical protein